MQNDIKYSHLAGWLSNNCFVRVLIPYYYAIGTEYIYKIICSALLLLLGSFYAQCDTELCSNKRQNKHTDTGGDGWHRRHRAQQLINQIANSVTSHYVISHKRYAAVQCAFMHMTFGRPWHHTGVWSPVRNAKCKTPISISTVETRSLSD